MNDAVKHRIFISYSHKDRKWLDELMTHLAPLRDSIEVWDDSRINAGENWQRQISEALTRASAAILLVSANFLASDFLLQTELPEISKAFEKRGMIVLPILVSSCIWEATSLEYFQFLNPPDKPLDTLSRAARNKAYVQIVEHIHARLSKPLPKKTGQAASTELADDIARKVFDMLKDELPVSPAPTSITPSTSESIDSTLVFVICAFSSDMDPVFEGIRAAASTVGLKAQRVKDLKGDYQITAQIMSMIATSRLVVADLTHERPNVYFELGYARGQGKTVVTCANEGTNIHFDVKDWAYISYSDSRVLEKELIDRFKFELEKGA